MSKLEVCQHSSITKTKKLNLNQVHGDSNSRTAGYSSAVTEVMNRFSDSACTSAFKTLHLTVGDATCNLTRNNKMPLRNWNVKIAV